MPAILPGSRAVLFTVQIGNLAVNDASVIAALDLKTGLRKTVVQGGSQPQFVGPGYLVYRAGNSLMAARFDAERLELTGESIPLVDGVLSKATLAAEFAVSREGTLVYVPGCATQGGSALSVTQPVRSLVWVDRRGREEPIDAPARQYVYARLSPDGTRVALDIRDRDADIWIWDLARRTFIRVTADPALKRHPCGPPMAAASSLVLSGPGR